MEWVRDPEPLRNPASASQSLAVAGGGPTLMRPLRGQALCLN